MYMKQFKKKILKILHITQIIISVHFSIIVTSFFCSSEHLYFELRKLNIYDQERSAVFKDFSNNEYIWKEVQCQGVAFSHFHCGALFRFMLGCFKIYIDYSSLNIILLEFYNWNIMVLSSCLLLNLKNVPSFIIIFFLNILYLFSWHGSAFFVKLKQTYTREKISTRHPSLYT